MDTAGVSGGGWKKGGLPRRAPVGFAESLSRRSSGSEVTADGNRDCLISNVKVETLTLEPHYRHLQQEALLGVVTAGSFGSGPTASSQFQRI